MALRCVSPYKAGPLKFEAGQLIEGLTADQEAHLLVDSPGCFEQVTETPPEAPPVDKAIKTATKKAAK